MRRETSLLLDRIVAFKATPLAKRIYSESSDQEMDIWLQVPKMVKSFSKSQDPPSYCQLWPKSWYFIVKTNFWCLTTQLAVPPADWPGHKTISMTVTPFKKSCRKEDPNHRLTFSPSPPSLAYWATFLHQALLSIKPGVHPEGVVLRREGELCPPSLQTPRWDLLQVGGRKNIAPELWIYSAGEKPHHDIVQGDCTA